MILPLPEKKTFLRRGRTFIYVNAGLTEPFNLFMKM